jgi:ADP-ribose pyrophosphatase YjhB (NUDIX family)
MDFRFCPRCRTELEMRERSGPDPERPTCPACGFVDYDPMRGEWNMPGGFVEAGESGPEAIRREVAEETALEIEPLEVIGVFSSTYGEGDDAEPIFDVAYRARIAGGELDVSEESSEAGWFSLAEFPRPAFAGERRALAALRERAAAG